MDKKISQSPLLFSFSIYTRISIIIILMFLKTSSGQRFYCSNTSIFADNTEYQTNLKTLFRFLSSNATNPNGYHGAEAGHSNTSSEVVYGHFLCRGDQNTSSCQNCVTTATTTDLPNHCPNGKEAIIWYDHCMVRYSNQSFFGKMENVPQVRFPIINNVIGNLIQSAQFLNFLMNMINNIAVRASNGGSHKKFATDMANYTSLQTLYGLGQCTPDLSPSDCNKCLEDGFQTVEQFSKGTRVLHPSCNVRFEMYPFFNNVSSLAHLPSTDSIHSNGDSKRKLTFLVVGLATTAAISILLLYGVWTCVRKKKVIETSSLEECEIKNVALDSLQFDLSTIQIATGHFAVDKKLGQGGFSEVYKGVLENGQEIAVKRLSDNSRQGNAEFKTEVALVAKLRHNNLVKLLGFCVSSEEKILVYEFLSRSSLDKFLVDPNRKVNLDWKTRFKIIVGVARGLLYLHEDSPLKVIHRDLKSSNILLDGDMNPKIADFGLAKLFGVDQTQGDTKRIVGTYGYMAPEYAITGHYSVKSDVYSFGIIVLELVSGKMNRFFGRLQLEEALLHFAWRLWNEGNSFGLVDPALSNNYSKEEVTKCIHISLLCIQEDATLRPRMTSIVADLNGQVHSLPMPKPPNFIGTMSNYEDNEIQHNPIGVYSGTNTITDLYPRD